jgi:Domain of Unknown Function with PDB structure (DUF3857)
VRPIFLTGAHAGDILACHKSSGFSPLPAFPVSFHPRSGSGGEGSEGVSAMSSLRLCTYRSSLSFIFLLVFSSFVPPSAASVGFQSVSQDELKMTSEPKAPGAVAVILFREVDRDDTARLAHEDVYFRVKILTEEGRKYADIEVPFDPGQTHIDNVHARTIEPDGSIVNFGEQVFEKQIVKTHGLKYMAKTFSLPNVQVGSILEYYYTINMNDQYIGFDSHWIISDELFTKNARFSLKPYAGDNPPLNLRWTWHDLPPGTADPMQAANHIVNLEVHDVPAFQTEDYMPPENELKARVDFIYSEDMFEKDPQVYWKKRAKKLNGQLEGFIGKRNAMEQAVSQIVAPGDAPEVKLRKMYARVQQIRNTSYEQEKTQQEQQREKEKAPSNVEDLWKKQYGSGVELTWLFLGLARAAGFDASGVWVADRANYFFSPQTMDGRRLDANVVLVKLNGNDLYFDPGAEFVSFGMLPWVETGVGGLKLDKDGGSWVVTTLPPSADSVIRRKAQLKFTEGGDLEGTLTVTYTGLEGTERRVVERLADDAARKKYLEDEVKEWIPAACDVDLTNNPDWKSSDDMVAEFNVKIPGWVAAAGRRALFTVGLFGNPEKHMFDHSERVHKIYFSFPYQLDDDVTVDLPLGWQISSLPAPQDNTGRVIGYTMHAENDKGTLHLKRTLNLDILLLEQKYYASLRNFYQMVRTTDEEQVILQPIASSASN